MLERSDEDLVVAARVDLEAFAELVRRHQRFVVGAAMRVVRDPVLAEDLAQEAFIRAHRALGDFRGDAQFRSWIYRIVTNLALNAVTRRREYPVDTVPDRTMGDAAFEHTQRAAIQADVRHALRQLPDALREPLVLFEFEDLSYEEISNRLDIPLNTVRTRIFRARRALGDMLEAWR